MSYHHCITKMLTGFGAKFNADGTLAPSTRRGIVYYKHQGKFIPLARNKKTKEPHIVANEEAAMDLINEVYLQNILISLLIGRTPPEGPSPNDFIFVPVDDPVEPEITDTSEAMSHIMALAK